MTIVRAVSWLGTAVVGWSLNIRWGTEEGLGNGPPPQFERPVTGAMLLCFIAAIAVSASGRKGRAPHWIARVLAVAGGGISVGLALMLRSRGPESAISGSGWAWMMAGSAAVLLAAAGTLALPWSKPDKPAPKNRRRKRR